MEERGTTMPPSPVYKKACLQSRASSSLRSPPPLPLSVLVSPATSNILCTCIRTFVVASRRAAPRPRRRCSTVNRQPHRRTDKSSKQPRVPSQVTGHFFMQWLRATDAPCPPCCFMINLMFWGMGSKDLQ